MRRRDLDEESAGATEPYEDPTLYDWEYRRRRADVRFYRMLAAERGGPVLDLGCGTGRMLTPLLRDGHRVVGLDRSTTMLARAAARLSRQPRAVRERGLLVLADLRAFAFKPGQFELAIAGFHGVQHLIEDSELLRFFRNVRRSLVPGGWFAFDVFAPDPSWLAQPAGRWFDQTIFRHPETGQPTEYSLALRFDAARKALHMRMGYRSLDGEGRPVGRRRVIRLCHRQLAPTAVRALLRRAGLELVRAWGGFAGEPLPGAASGEDAHSDNDSDDAAHVEQHVYLARRPRA